MEGCGLSPPGTEAGTRRRRLRLLGLRRGETHVAVARRANRGSNKNDVPSAKVRRELKAWMLAEFGDGISAPCFGTCGRRLLWSEITRDRFPISGRKGGRYVRGNIRPMCGSCNYADGARAAAQERAEAKRKKDARNARRRELYAMRNAVVTEDQMVA